MGKFWKKQEDELTDSASKTLGFSKEMFSSMQKFQIKKYKFTSLEQVQDIKTQLLGKKILILNAKDLLEKSGGKISQLKKAIEELKMFVRENGGSIGRLGDQYLILTPNSHVRISN
jgi:SepF-like predicted cell division protein (DUF552 family)